MRTKNRIQVNAWRGFGISIVLTAFAATAAGSGHGPVFGLATPTNAKGGWSLDLGTMGRVGENTSGTMERAMFSYGVTEDLQLSFSVPGIFTSAPLPPARITGMMPSSPDFEGLAAWRFQRHAPDVGTRLETTAYVGLLVPGPQRPAGMLGSLQRAPGLYTAITTGMASRANYIWGGIGNTHYAQRGGDQRPNIFTYTFVYGYRPIPLRKDYPHWDWRVFAEMTGEDSSRMLRAGTVMPGTGGDQLLLGPGTLGIYKNYAIEAGIQFHVYRSTGPAFEREKFRFAINFSYFF